MSNVCESVSLYEISILDLVSIAEQRVRLHLPRNVNFDDDDDDDDDYDDYDDDDDDDNEDMFSKSYYIPMKLLPSVFIDENIQ